MLNKNDDFKSKFGDRLKFIRKLSGMSQGALAERTDLARDTISRYERGDLMPSAEALGRLVSTLDRTVDFDVDADWFLFGSSEQLKNSLEAKKITSFGTVTKLLFTGMGRAEVSAGTSEICRLLDTFEEILTEAGADASKLIDSRGIKEVLYKENYEPPDIILEVPIAVYGAKLSPIIPKE